MKTIPFYSPLHGFRVHALMVMFSCLLLMNVSCQKSTAVKAEDWPLEGKTFAIEMKEAGKPDAQKDDLVFKDKKMDSPSCHEWGFAASDYTVGGTTDEITFNCKMTSAAEGSMVWTGTVKGKKLSGDCVWSKQGQADIRYAIEGKEK